MANANHLHTRVQRSRKKGSRQPEGTLYCGRGTAWGNPAYIGSRLFIDGLGFISIETNKDAVAVFRIYARQQLRLFPEWLEPLRKAKHVSCFCKLGEVCHVEVLLEMMEE